MATERRMGTKKRVVPWFSMNEWVAVYQLLYSQNVEQQRNAVDRIISWKARCSHLPVGVECSLGIAQVLLDDPDHLLQTSVSITREQQLRLVYSTAVMRFLNLMLEIKKDGETAGTMYNKAAQHNIPEWIVNLRHDAAHGVALPDLSLLRTAAVFIFKWLDEHYWEKEMQLVIDWHVTESEVLAVSAKERELQDIMETWEALSLYSLAGFHQLRLIPDNEIMEKITSIHQMLSEDDRKGETGMELEINHAMVSTALKLVLRRVARFFKNSFLGKSSCMAKALIDGDYFLPSPSLMKILYPNEFDSESPLLQLPEALSNSCEELLSNLWNLGAIPDLVSNLISVSCDVKESDLRRNMAALWVQKILLSCLKVREARRVFSAIQDKMPRDVVRHYRELHPDLSKKSILLTLAFRAVECQRAELMQGYTWNASMQIPISLTNIDLVKQCFLQPSEFCSIFLPCLMELTSPPIPLTSRKLLLDLVGAFSINDMDLEENVDSQIFSVKDISNECSPVSEKDVHDSQCTEPEEKSRWTLSQDYLEWHKCPLGALPWQREQDHLEQAECDGKQQQRTWPKLFMAGDWSKITTDISEVPSSNTGKTPALKRVKEGRVKKQVATTLGTPIRALKMKKFSPSPREKAIKVLTSL